MPLMFLLTKHRSCFVPRFLRRWSSIYKLFALLGRKATFTHSADDFLIYWTDIPISVSIRTL